MGGECPKRIISRLHTPQQQQVDAQSLDDDEKERHAKIGISRLLCQISYLAAPKTHLELKNEDVMVS